MSKKLSDIPYYITQRKIILSKYLNADVAKIIISYMFDTLLVKHRGIQYSRSLKINNINQYIFLQIQKEVDNLLGFSLLAKADGVYKSHEIISIGSYLRDSNLNIRYVDIDMSYKDFCLSDPNNFKINDFTITKIDGCLYDVVSGFDIQLLILKSIYGLKYSKISKKRRDKMKSNGVRSIHV